MLRLLLSTSRSGPNVMPRLHAKLTRATRQSVALVRIDSVTDQPTLLLDAIRDGRVLVDRRGTAWNKLKRQRWRLLREERPGPSTAERVQPRQPLHLMASYAAACSAQSR